MNLLLIIFIVIVSSVLSFEAKANRNVGALIPILNSLLLDETPPIFQCRARLIVDLNGPNSNGSFRVKPQFTEMGHQTFFFADHPDYGTELWRTDGTTSGTHIVKDVYPGTRDGIQSGALLEEKLLERVDNQVFFLANDGVNGEELWVTDGTNSGTRLVKDITQDSTGSAITNLTVFNGRLYFRVWSGATGADDEGLWTSDGTSSGTYLVQRIPRFGFLEENSMAVVNDYLIFAERAEDIGVELWRSDGTAGGTSVLKNINPDGSSSPRDFSVVGDKLYFVANDSNDTSVWVTDGTNSGTIKLRGSQDYSFPRIRIDFGFKENQGLNDVLYFSAFTPEHGDEIWRTDGTPNGTQLVRDVNFGSRSSLGFFGDGFSSAQAFNNQFFFEADTEALGRELWKVGEDGVVTLVRDLHPGVFGASGLGSNPQEAAASQDFLFFSAEAGTLTQGDEPTVMDKEGRIHQIDVFSGASGTNPEGFFVRSDQSVLFTSANRFFSAGPGVGLHIIECPQSDVTSVN